MRSKNVFLFLEQSKRFLRLRNPMPLRYLTTKPSNFCCWLSDDTLFCLCGQSSFRDSLWEFFGGKRQDPPFYYDVDWFEIKKTKVARLAANQGTMVRWQSLRFSGV